jgi:hypothetical protein
VVEVGGGEVEEVVGTHWPDCRHCCNAVRCAVEGCGPRERWSWGIWWAAFTVRPGESQSACAAAADPRPVELRSLYSQRL